MASSQTKKSLPSIAALSWDDCRLLVESVTDYAIFMLDPSGHVATWNRGAERIKGYKADEIIGQHFSRFFEPEDIAAGKPQRELETAAEQNRFEDEGWRLRKDGTRFWANVVITALRDEDGRLRGYAKVTRDLTHRRLAEEELRRAEDRFHHLVDAVTDYAIYMLDATGHVVTWNPGAARIKGYSAEEIVGRSFSLFYAPEDRAAGKPEKVLDTVRSEGRYEEENWRVRKDGARFWAHVVITALRDGKGNVVGFAKVTRDLSERRRAEENLRRSEERFRLLVDSVSDYAIYMLDPTGHVSTWNRGAERLKGYSSEEILGRHFSLFFPEEDQQKGKPARELDAARTFGRYEDEGYRVRKDGTRFWANAIITALHDHSEKLIGFAKITRDLTSRRAAEETARNLLREQAARAAAEEGKRQLRDSEERYRAISKRLEVILEGVDDGISVQDPSGKVVFANRAAAKISGFASGEELLSTPFTELMGRYEIFDERGRPFSLEELPGRRALNGEHGASALIRVKERASGREWWSVIRASPVLDSAGKPELAVNIWHDVTTERRHDQQARHLADATSALSTSLESDAMLANLAGVLVPGLADGCAVYLLQDDGQLRNVATAQVDSLPAAAIEKYVRTKPQNGSALHNPVSDVPLPWEEQTRGSCESLGIRSGLVVPIRIRDRVAGVIALVTAESDRRYDSTDLTLAEELGRRAGVALENARLYAAAHESARRAEAAAKRADDANRIKDEFLATVSHELRTPLNAINGWASLLQDRNLEPTAAKGVDIIRRNAQAQGKIIDDILDVSRIITGKLRLELQRTDLTAIAREAVDVVLPSIKAKRIEFEFIAPPDPCVLVADPERMRQVLWNLLSNAVKFTEAGDRISMRIERDGSKIVVNVSDTGSGIEPEFLPYVFERFKQADSSTTRRWGGLGLGLSIVRHIVELHGGRVEASSPGLGKGATFALTFPILAVVPTMRGEDETVGPRGVSEHPQKRRHVLDGLRVLVVDDDADARDLMLALLTEAGATVETVASPGEAFDRLQRFHPHVFVSDIGMPDEDGYTLMRRIRALDESLGGNVPAIALTAYARGEDKTKASAAGFTTHIGKPVDPDDLLKAVESLARPQTQATGA